MNTRRKFLHQSALGGAALSLAPFLNLSCMSNKGLPYADTIGLQLYTLRFQLEEDTPGTLAALKKMGYHQVELMDIRQDQEQLKIARDLGLAVNSSFFNWTAITGRGENPENLDRVIETAEASKLSHLVFGYIPKEDRGTIDDYLRIIEGLNQAGEQCQAAGMQLCYHHHSFEFGPIEGQVPFELLIEKLDPNLVKFELDVFWASIGGYDPLALMDRLQGRIRLLHLKDKKTGAADEFDESVIPHDVYKELGQGEIAMTAIIDKAVALNVEHCFVEQDRSPDPLKSVQQSLHFMETT